MAGCTVANGLTCLARSGPSTDTPVFLGLQMTTSGFLLGKRLLFGGPIAAAQTAQVGFTLLVTLTQVVMFTPALLKKDEVVLAWA